MPMIAAPMPDADERHLGDRRVADALRPELGEHALGDAHRAAHLGDVLAHDEDLVVAPHRLRHRVAHGLPVGELRHRRSPARPRACARSVARELDGALDHAHDLGVDRRQLVVRETELRPQLLERILRLAQLLLLALRPVDLRVADVVADEAVRLREQEDRPRALARVRERPRRRARGRPRRPARRPSSSASRTRPRAS